MVSFSHSKTNQNNYRLKEENRFHSRNHILNYGDLKQNENIYILLKNINKRWKEKKQKEIQGRLTGFMRLAFILDAMAD